MSITIALAGNPNCGKTTLFNALTGSNQYVGNWPGVTVEKKEGKLKKHDDVIITDLPGIYSLSPYTLEEVVARNYLLNEKPDAILNMVDGTNLERNLYLTTQIIEIGIPVVVAINMMDVVRKHGDEINPEELAKVLGCKVVEISALKGTGIEEAAEVAIEAAKNGRIIPRHIFSGPVEHAIAHIEEALLHEQPEEQQRWYAVKIFERDVRVIEELNIPEDKLKHIEKDIKACEKELDDDSDSIIINDRYNYITNNINKFLHKENKLTTSELIDRIVTNRWLGLPIFFFVMFLVYYVSISTVGGIATDWVNDCLFGEEFSFFGHMVPGVPSLINNVLISVNCAEWLQGLIIDGIVAGVGAVIGFLPQLFVLFLFLAFLEACGYMSRVAFVLDKIFRKFGLSGKSFIPLLIASGCGVPGIMSSRTIESENDRRMTVMTTTFIPCSAKLPFIGLMAGAIFKGASWVAPSTYFMGIITVILSGIILKKTKIFAGDPTPFVMELPSYHMPTPGAVFRSMWERGWSFIKKAFTIILISTIFVWFTTYFGFTDEGFRMLGDDELGLSILAKIGSLLAWIFIPLGFGNWQATVATFTGLIAKENIVGTLGILYGVGEGNPYGMISQAFTPYSGYAFLAFNLLCAPCVAAMGAIRKEMNSAKWFWIAIGYQCGLAYAVSLVINQLGKLFFGTGSPSGILISLALIVIFFIFLLRPSRKKG